jgi:hypothetical protein
MDQKEQTMDYPNFANAVWNLLDGSDPRARGLFLSWKWKKEPK